MDHQIRWLYLLRISLLSNDRFLDALWCAEWMLSRAFRLGNNQKGGFQDQADKQGMEIRIMPRLLVFDAMG
jgi:hypothetical protein